MIEVKHLTKRFGRFTALDDLSLTVPTGAIYGLVGPNGAGKSTVIRHITGIYRQDSGEVCIDGIPVYENAPLKSQIAYIPDDIFFYASAGLRDMMKFYAGLYPNFDRTMYQALLQLFSLDEKQPLRQFSKGMQKQAAFLLSICTRPNVIVLDEPVDGLDPVMRRQVWSLLMQDVSDRGTTVLLSSHNLRELEDVCDHVGIMHKGKMLLERTLSELQDNVVKAQVVFADERRPENLRILHESTSGRIHTLIIRGAQEAVAAALEALSPVFYDIIPLTLEEIFIYELGGVDYEVKSIIL